MSSDLYVQQLALGPMQNFVYLVGAQRSPEVAVVDPAWDVPAIERAAAEGGRTISAVLLTHGHLDHVNGVAELLSRHDVPVHAQRAEVEFSENLAGFRGALRPIGPGDEVRVGALPVTALHTPGHTPGAQCLSCAGAVFTGDTVFVNGCGRCDFPGSDPAAMYRSLTQTLAGLPDETRLYPGHDYGDVPVSTLGRERAQNPYFRCPDLEAFVAYRMRPR